MNIVLRLLPFAIGFGIAYLVGINLAHFSHPLKLVISSATALCLGYFFIWYNIQMMKRNGEISRTKVLTQNRIGHLLLLCAALIVGYGFSYHNQLAMLTSLVLWWLADDMLTKTGTPPSLPSSESTQPKQQTSSTAQESLLRAIAEKRKTDPQIGIKIGGREVFQRLLDGMKGERGVHAESLLCALGSLAGYSCQASVRAQALQKGLPETSGLVVVDTKDGRKYFFGDELNKPLAESQYSIWSLASAAAQQNGCLNLPDINAVFEHVSNTIGGNSFGLPRTPSEHRASDTPINYLKELWPVIFPLAKQFCIHPSEWPILFGVAIQEAMKASKEALTADLAVTIVIESAVPMSKVDLTAA